MTAHSLLPTLQAADLRRALIEYLSTTFALTDDDVRASLETFLTDPESGVFRGPYVRLRLPFRPADGTWSVPLDWYPEGFTPYGHQARAFERLSSKHSSPRPTLVTTGTGSGKTESFLIPIVDHALRARARGQRGLKALILYPMNALANDQAGRLAAMLSGDPRLGGLTAGLYTGEQGSQRTMVSSEGLITDRAVLRADPPDVLLTNYKMLDQLLLRSVDASLWDGAAESLTYLVLDEFHTYDGAQGTDVAMLLRRLGAALGIAEPGAPLGGITPVATSATLGGSPEETGGPESSAAMRAFAATVFGRPIEPDAVIVEDRLTAEEWRLERAGTPGANAGSRRYVARSLPGAAIVAEALADQLTPEVAMEALLAALFARTGSAGQAGAGDELDPADARRLLGSDDLAVLLTDHELTAHILAHAECPIALRDLAARIFPSDTSTDRADGTLVLNTYLALLSLARAELFDGSEGRRFLGVDVQLWIREVSRIDRLASTHAAFRWGDDGVADTDEGLYLPALYCRHCGRSGWGATRNVTGMTLDAGDTAIRTASLTGDDRFRALLYAGGEAVAVEATGEKVPDLLWLDTRSHELLHEPAQDAGLDESPLVPVLVDWEDREGSARRETCPSCGQVDAIRFLGSGISTLTSVSLSTIFGSPDLDPAEKKTLLFTDSVQDAAHTAGFVQSRSHTLSLRAALRGALADDPLTLPDLADAVLEAAHEPVRRYRLVPPRLVDRQNFQPFWQMTGTAAQQRSAARTVATRLAFDIALEFGLNSRTGRTLELTGSAVAEVDVGHRDRLLRAVGAALERAREQHSLSAEVDEVVGLGLDDQRARAWARGVLERIRTRGGIAHPWLETYLQNDGNRWFLTGGRGRNRDAGMQAFRTGRPAPAFPTTERGNDNLDGISGAASWYARWAERQLGVTPRDGALLTSALLEQAVAEGWLTSAPTLKGATTFRLPPERVVVRLPDDAALLAGEHTLRCDVCQTLTPGGRETIADLEGAACLRQGCPGRLRRHQPGPDYYRGLYASPDMRRVVAREHTSLLPDRDRLAVEESFKTGSGPDVPNVLAATPTLELGIDIGDLSTVMLGSLPRSVAAYLQRIGRAGRATGNALVLAYVRGRGQNLQRLNDPLSVIDGTVRPPATFLDAVEILQRQYAAFLVDRRARAGIPDPGNARAVFGGGWAPGTWLGDLLLDARTNAVPHIDAFLALFGAGVRPDTATALRTWAGVDVPEETPSGLEQLVHVATLGYDHETKEIGFRERAVADVLPGLRQAAEEPAATDDDKRDYRMAQSEQRFLRGRRTELANQFWVAALEERGVLPNYTLLDDTVTLDISLRWTDQETGEFQEESRSYQRGSSLALTEWAPGATFYAQGVAVRIDAVDVGSDIEGVVQAWRVCPSCGWSATESHDATAVEACPRCGSAGIKDTGQVLEVIPLERVTAQVSRDESVISDTRDDRERTQFTVVAAADIKPSDIAEAWRLADYPFGAEYVRAVEIRWVNVGRTLSQGAERFLAGSLVKTPLFTICPGCGIVPTAQARRDSEARHRGWCPQRRELDVPWREVALGRVLHTQAVRLLVPPQFTLDLFAGPSFRAALLLGLREVIGGDPDHLDILEVHAPVDGTDRTALLLHDKVPGGTGYLADFARPDRVRELLEAALDIVRNCACKDEALLACAECLLPFSPPALVDHTSRARAEQILTEILEGGREDGSGWHVQRAASIADVPAPSAESHLEQRFRTALVAALKARGAQVREEPQLNGTVVRIGMPGARHRQWTLRPQPLLGFVQPDFELLTDDPSVPRMCIFTDGRRWHASQSSNRLADDAEKRTGLRDAGYVVWAVTSDDVDVFEARQHGNDTRRALGSAWLTPEVGTQLTSLRTKTTIPAGSVDDQLATADAVTQILSWITNPDPESWRRLASVLPLAFQAPHRRAAWDRDELPRVVTAALAGQSTPARSDPGLAGWWWSEAGLALAVAAVVQPALDVGAVLAVDDSPETLATTHGERAWRMWLALSNLLGLAERLPVITTLSLLQSGKLATPAAPTGATAERGEPASVSPTLSPIWNDLLEHALSPAESLLLEALAQAGAPVPEQGYELDDGTPIDLAWPGVQVAVLMQPDSDLEKSLIENGWRVVQGEDVDQVLAAVGGSD